MGSVGPEVPTGTAGRAHASCPAPQYGEAAPKLRQSGQVGECRPPIAGSDFSRGAENLGFSVIYQFLNVGNSFQMFSIIMWPKKPVCGLASIRWSLVRDPRDRTSGSQSAFRSVASFTLPAALPGGHSGDISDRRRVRL